MKEIKIDRITIETLIGGICIFLLWLIPTIIIATIYIVEKGERYRGY